MSVKQDKRVLCAYNGKVVDMKYVPDPKRRFNFACLRITDNAREGYVLDGEKVYAVVRGSKTARLLHGDERDAAMRAFESEAA